MEYVWVNRASLTRLTQIFLNCLKTTFSTLPVIKIAYHLAKTVNLPFLADSINEGTIAEFVKSNFFINNLQNKEIGLNKIKLLLMSKLIKLLSRLKALIPAR